MSEDWEYPPLLQILAVVLVILGAGAVVAGLFWLFIRWMDP